MTAARRWILVALGVVVLIATPVTLRLLPASGSDASARELLHRARTTSDVPFSGYARSVGTLQLPLTDRFSSLSSLLGGSTRMHVWWRSTDLWRIDTLRTTGESDLFHDRLGTTSWSYESNRASRADNVPVRLPDVSDVLPPSLARRALSGARASEVRATGARRIAGRDADGISMRPADTRSTIARVDVWLDAASGVPLRTDVYADGDRTPSLSTSFETFAATASRTSTLTFTSSPGVRIRSDDIIDIAAAADRFSRQRPPRTLAGLAPRKGSPTTAVGLYGRGVTSLMAVPLWGRAARPLREQLRSVLGVETDVSGQRLTVGPLALLLTPPDVQGDSWLLLGTVDSSVLIKAAAQLADGTQGPR